MTVPEPTPDHASRWSLVRRAGFVTTAAGLTVAFALSLSGIASTRGTVRPETQAAVVAAAQRHSDASDDRHADAAPRPLPPRRPPARRRHQLRPQSESASHEALSRLPGSLPILRGQ